MKILIADDDPSFTLLLSTFLKAKGHTVAIAYDALQTLSSVMREPPDAIVLDIVMPGGSGLHALRRMKASTKTNRIPVVIVTASSDPQLPSAVRSLGADEFLRKPFEFERLYETLTRLGQKAAVERPLPPPPGGEDAATFLRDRQTILDELWAEFTRALRQNSSLSLVMAEIDGFERLRAVHGAAAGELILGETLRRFRPCLRAYDKVGSYDEGKFLLILPGCRGTAAMKKAESLRAAIAEKAMATAQGPVVITISLGVGGSSNVKATNFASLLRAAEEAVLRGGAAGGNRVELASELTTDTPVPAAQPT